MTELTEKQAEVLELIKKHIAVNGFPPTRAEIALVFNIQPNAVQARLAGLIKKGAVTDVPGKTRSIVPVKGFKMRIKQ